MKRRKFLIWLAKAWGGYFGLAAVGTLPPLLKINTVRLGEARAAVLEPCVCEANDECFCEGNDICICEGTDLSVCAVDGYDGACTPDTCSVQDGCLSSDTIVRQCRISDVCGTDVSLDCRGDNCDADSSGECIGDACSSDSSGQCKADNCTDDSSNACQTDQCGPDSSAACRSDNCSSDASGGCVSDQCTDDSSGSSISDVCDADSSGACLGDQCASDKSGACLSDDCTSDKSGVCQADYCASDSSKAGWGDNCVSDSSGECRNDQCGSDSSGACIGDNCGDDSSGGCTGDEGTADASGLCVGDRCYADSSGECGGDRCVSDKSAACNASDVCVSDKSGICDTDLCRSDSGWDCATRDVCASDITPPAPAVASVSRALRWLYRLSMVFLAVALVPDEAVAATVIDAGDAVFSVDPVFQTTQAVGAPDFVGAFIRDCDGDGIQEADTNGDGSCTGDPELRDYNADGSRELPNGTPFAGSFQFACFHVPVDVALITTGPVTIASAGDVGIYGSVYYAGTFTLAAAGSIDLRTSAWMADAGGTATFRTALSGEVDQTQNDYSETPLPDLAFNGVCAAAIGGAQEIPVLNAWGLTLLAGLLAAFAWGALRGGGGASGRRSG